MDQRCSPLVVVVTGRPGAGKATLAHKLVDALRCPLVSRDQTKEGMLLTLGAESATDPDVTDQTYRAFFATIELLAGANVSLVAEAAFQHKVWAPRLEALTASADVRIVVCEVSAEVAQQRRQERSRQDRLFDTFHPGPVPDDYDPPRLDVPTLAVDTTDGYSPALGDILAFLR